MKPFTVKKIILFVLCFCFATATAALCAEALTGTFALQGGTARTDAYLVAGQPANAPLAFDLNLWLTPLDSKAAITSYDLDMTKMLHAVIVSDDFKTFLHEHPKLEPNGHFVLNQQLPGEGLYYLFADGEPQGVGQQVFRFDLQVGPRTPNRARVRDLSERSPTCLVDGYAVTLTSLSLRAGVDSKIDVHIKRAGKPADDLHPYLGALAHAVFIDAADLSYVHVHPTQFGSAGDDMAGMSGMKGMDMSAPSLAADATSSPDMTLHVHVIEPGTYKLWLQFAGGGGLHVAQFVLTAG